MITNINPDLKRDCNFLAMFYYRFISFSKEKPTEKQIINFVKKYHQTEMKEACQARKFLKQLCKN